MTKQTLIPNETVITTWKGLTLTNYRILSDDNVYTVSIALDALTSYTVAKKYNVLSLILSVMFAAFTLALITIGGETTAIAMGVITLAPIAHLLATYQKALVVNVSGFAHQQVFKIGDTDNEFDSFFDTAFEQRLKLLNLDKK